MNKKWHPSRNGVLRLEDFSKSSRKKVWWICNEGHESFGTVLSKDSLCAYCSGQRVLAGFNDLATLKPELAAQWHPTRNGSLSANMVTSRSGRKVWWKCDKGHDFEALVSNRLNSSHCPVCYGRQSLEGFNDLATMAPSLASEWHPSKNGKLTPTNVTCGSHKKVWWQCDKGHEWQASVKDRKNRGCPYCGNKKILIGFNDLASTHPNVAVYWDKDKNIGLKPFEVTIGSHKKVWWKGINCNHSWFREVYSQAKSIGCPKCVSYVSKPEILIADFLENLGFIVERQNRSLLSGRELDIYLPEKNMAIEFNGLYWHSEEKGKNNNYHYAKWKACKNKNVILFYIWEDAWLLEQDNILSMLKAVVRNEKVAVEEKNFIFQKGSLEEYYFDLSGFKIQSHLPPQLIKNQQNFLVWNAGSTIYVKP